MQNTKIKIFIISSKLCPLCQTFTFLGQITTKKIEQLAVKIHQSSWKFNQIVCLARGGLVDWLLPGYTSSRWQFCNLVLRWSWQARERNVNIFLAT